MKSSDRAILMGLLVVGVMAAFWFLALAPKREEAAALGDEVTELRADVEVQQQAAAAGELAKEGFDENYRRLVVLGKAVPEDDDTATLMTQLQAESVRAKVDFRSIELQDQSGGTEAEQVAAPPPLEQPGAGAEGEPAEGEAATTAPVETAVPATEAAAATLPIGASIGPAGLPVMPYALDFQGGFFQIADFLALLDKQVKSNGAQVGVRGRLLTVDGFSLSPTVDTGNPPQLDANLAVTTYLTPVDQGALAGATLGGPAAVPVTATPAETAAPTTTGTVTP
jgi:hypothetical protein